MSRYGKPDGLEPIETRQPSTSCARCSWRACNGRSRHAYENVAPLPARSATTRASIPTTCSRSTTSRGSRSPSRATCATNYPFGMFAVPREQVARIHASRGTTGKPTVVGYTRSDIDNWADLVARSIRAAGRPARRHGATSPTATACSPAASARTTAPSALGCTVIPMSGGQTEKQVQLILDFKPRHHHGHAVLHAGASSRSWSAGHRSARRRALRDRHLRRRAVDRGDAARDRGQRSASTRSTSTASRK